MYELPFIIWQVCMYAYVHVVFAYVRTRLLVLHMSCLLSVSTSCWDVLCATSFRASTVSVLSFCHIWNSLHYTCAIFFFFFCNGYSCYEGLCCEKLPRLYTCLSTSRFCHFASPWCRMVEQQVKQVSVTRATQILVEKVPVCFNLAQLEVVCGNNYFSVVVLGMCGRFSRNLRSQPVSKFTAWSIRWKAVHRLMFDGVLCKRYHCNCDCLHWVQVLSKHCDASAALQFSWVK